MDLSLHRPAKIQKTQYPNHSFAARARASHPQISHEMSDDSHPVERGKDDPYIISCNDDDNNDNDNDCRLEAREARLLTVG
jgi:hypothetical protein